MLSFQFKNVKKTTEEYASLKTSAMEVQLASDYPTDQARSFVVTGEDDFVFNYFKEKIDTKRRENALEALHNELGDIQAYKDLSNAVDSSVALVYRKADRAMYHVKTHTKSGYCFYDEIKVCK